MGGNRIGGYREVAVIGLAVIIGGYRQVAVIV